MVQYYPEDSNIDIDGKRIPVIYNSGDSYIDVNGEKYIVSSNLCKEISIGQKVVYVGSYEQMNHSKFLLIKDELIKYYIS